MAVTTLEELDAMEEKRLQEQEEGDSFDELEEIPSENLRSASELLKRNAILFEFLSDTDYCKSLTKRYRELMEMQASRTWDLIEKLEAEIEEDESLEEF